MKKSVAALAGAVCAAALLVPSFAHAAKSSVVIKNKSDWEIHEFYLSSVDEDDWGPDQLGEHVISTGDTFTLNGIPCDSYDVRLVDEDQDECIVPAVDICSGQEGWIITNDDLLDCEAETAEE